MQPEITPAFSSLTQSLVDAGEGRIPFLPTIQKLNIDYILVFFSLVLPPPGGAEVTGGDWRAATTARW